MAGKISIAEVRRRLPVGMRFVGTFTSTNASIAKQGSVETHRVVRKNNGRELVSEFATGPRAGELIYLSGWSGLTAEENDAGEIILTEESLGPFLKIKPLPDAREFMPGDRVQVSSSMASGSGTVLDTSPPAGYVDVQFTSGACQVPAIGCHHIPQEQSDGAQTQARTAEAEDAVLSAPIGSRPRRKP